MQVHNQPYQEVLENWTRERKEVRAEDEEEEKGIEKFVPVEINQSNLKQN